MTSNRPFLVLTALGIVLGAYSNTSYSKPADATKPVHNLNENKYILEWLVAGTFPNPATDEPLPDGTYHYGFYTDFLKSLGGETKAMFNDSTTIRYADQHGVVHVIHTQLIQAGKNGIIDFDNMFNKPDQQVAYAFCYLNSDKAQTAWFRFGSDDGAKVWINGELVHQNYVARSLRYGDDRFRATLKPGLNPILVKVEDRVREWGFVIEALDETRYQKIMAEAQARQDFDDFLNCPIVPKTINTWNFVFSPGEFPELQWERPYLVEKAVGKFPLTIRWFDAQLNEVTTAEQPGRYAFLVEGTTPNGLKIRQAATI